MIPVFSSFWDGVGDKWLVSRAAFASFACASVLVAFMTVALAFDFVRDTGTLTETAWGTAGVLAGVSVFFIWSGMWRYWTKLDRSSRFARRCWFVVLLLGLWYGAILYFIFVYIPYCVRASYAQGREVTS
jgi:hypothetical protein